MNTFTFSKQPNLVAHLKLIKHDECTEQVIIVVNTAAPKMLKADSYFKDIKDDVVFKNHSFVGLGHLEFNEATLSKLIENYIKRFK